MHRSLIDSLTLLQPFEVRGRLLPGLLPDHPYRPVRISGQRDDLQAVLEGEMICNLYGNLAAMKSRQARCHRPQPSVPSIPSVPGPPPQELRSPDHVMCHTPVKHQPCTSVKQQEQKQSRCLTGCYRHSGLPPSSCRRRRKRGSAVGGADATGAGDSSTAAGGGDHSDCSTPCDVLGGGGGE